MKFCTKCGEQVDPNKNACDACGEVIKEKKEEKIEKKPLNTRKISFTLSKKHKWIAGILAFLLVIGFAGIRIGGSLTSPERFVDKFQQALIEEDMEALQSFVYSSDPRVTVDENSLGAFVQYLKDHPSVFGNLIDDLMMQAEALQIQEGEEEENPSYARDYSLLRLEKTGKQMLFFNRYQVEPMTFYMVLSTNQENAALYINDEHVDTANQENFEKEYGPFLPGYYQYRAVLEGDYVELETEKEEAVFDPYYQKVYIDLSLHGNYINPVSNMNRATLVANGQDTGLLISETSSFGPVSTDGSLELQATVELPWEVLVSEEIVVENQSRVDLPLEPLTDKLTMDLMEVVNEYMLTRIEALKEQDTSGIKNATEEILAETRDIYVNYQEKGYDFDGNLLHMRYDLNSFSFREQQGQYTVTVNLQVDMESSWHVSGEEYSLSEKTENYTITLGYSEEESSWMVSNVSSAWRINTSNVEEFSF